MRVLIAEHRASLGPLLSDHFALSGATVSLAISLDAAINHLRFGTFDVMVLAFDLPANGAIVLADYLVLRLPDLPVIVTVEATFQNDATVFTQIPNARAVLHSPLQMYDLVATAEHYAARALRD